MMTVRELIEALRKFDPDLPVCFERFSEHCLMGSDQLVTKQLQPARPDGWVHDARPDKPSTTYIVFPGN